MLTALLRGFAQERTRDPQEVKRANALLTRAREATTLGSAMVPLREYLDQASTNRFGYDPLPVWSVLGKYVLAYAVQQDSTIVQPSKGTSCTLGNAVATAAFALREAGEIGLGNGRWNEGEIAKHALNAGKRVQAENYRQLFVNCALYALRVESQAETDLGSLVEEYEAMVQSYTKTTGEIAIPIVRYEREEEVIERNATQVVYRAAINNRLAYLRSIVKEEDAASDALANDVEKTIARIQTYKTSAELTAEETQKVGGWVLELKTRYDARVTEEGARVCQQQDTLWEVFESYCEMGAQKEALRAEEVLIQFTAKYTRVLEETVEELRERTASVMRQHGVN